MKAVLSKEVGGPETLVVEDIAEPTAGKGEVLVKVAACAINFPDTLIIRDMYQFKRPAARSRARSKLSAKASRASPSVTA